MAFVVAIFAGLSAQAGIKSERTLAAILKHTPASTIVATGEQIRAAEHAAASIPGAEAMWGVGESMAPLYSSRTAIVVAPIKFSDLRKGMTVVYVSRRGNMVCHSLTGDLPKGWIAQGVNNDEEDDDLVTANNLVGVIVGAYSEMPSEFRTMLAKQLIAKGRLPAGQS
ncbi:hypothetical protein DB354_00455 [Opitutus sp. ER46]|nr:hypothetical protein DB354_00455 [Opitutus sp. ER46]